mgnify:CR=1 FL=1
MSQAERIYKIERLLKNKKIVSLQTFLRELEVSPATFRRDLDLLRDRMRAPIPYDRAEGGYRLEAAEANGERHELPGLWFNSKELHALLTFHHLLENLEPGLLAPHIEPLKDRIEALLQSKKQSPAEIMRRVRILPQAARRAEPARFQLVAHALLARRRLRMRYHGRARNAATDRTVSPQRLVHYRDNWYLDAWDHGKRALRTFSLDRIAEATLVDRPARDVADTRLDRYFAESYGIFAGRPRRTAVLRFTPERSRWVAEERWHPNQRGRFDGERYILEIPYSDERELVLDILRYGPDVEVLRPKSLRQKVLDQLLRAVSLYRPDKRNITR